MLRFERQWNGLSLAQDWKADLPGCASGLAERPGAPNELAVFIMGPNGKTSIWYFEKSASPQ
ncbi:MAG: hypothetical protein HY922_08650 [Elusimicrobia bacterium]|nr:hypothetical protein [Elusimicrobiota bacterium]